MSQPRVLIVDDQKDVVRLLQSGIESTGHDVEVVGVMSGEEALLEISRKAVDLLVVDYMLPGMSGLELLGKVRARNPEAQAIFITGRTERNIHREIMAANVQAFFVKPISMADFLDAVERSLGLVRTILPQDALVSDEANRETLSGLVSRLRHKLDALAVILLNQEGLVTVQAGELPDSSHEATLYATLTAMAELGYRVASLLDTEADRQLHAFRQEMYDLLALPVARTHLLLIVGERLLESERLQEWLPNLMSIRAEVREILADLGVVPDVEDASGEPADESAAAEADAADDLDDEPLAEDLVALFETGPQTVSDPDAFWDEAVNGHKPAPLSSNVITYEEARKMGLAPDDEELPDA